MLFPLDKYKIIDYYSSMNEKDRSGFSDEDWDKWIKSREPTHDDYAWEDEEPPIEVGDLVRESEGARMAGLVIKVFKKEFNRVQVLWPDGERWTYKSIFLKKM